MFKRINKHRRYKRIWVNMSIQCYMRIFSIISVFQICFYILKYSFTTQLSIFMKYVTIYLFSIILCEQRWVNYWIILKTITIKLCWYLYCNVFWVYLTHQSPVECSWVLCISIPRLSLILSYTYLHIFRANRDICIYFVGDKSNYVLAIIQDK